MTIESNGNVGIGTTTPAGRLDVSGGRIFLDNAQSLRLRGTGSFFSEIQMDNSDNLTLGNFEGGPIILATDTTPGNATTRLTVEADGDVIIGTLRVDATNNRVGIGTASPTAQLHTTGSVRLANFGAGTLQTDASGNVSVSSDVRLKNIQGDFARGLTEVLKLQPINYTWKEETGLDTENIYTGFSAQNVRDVIPEAVSTDRKGYLTLSDRPLLAALVNAVQELKTENEALDARLSQYDELQKTMVRVEMALQELAGIKSYKNSNATPEAVARSLHR